MTTTPITMTTIDRLSHGVGARHRPPPAQMVEQRIWGRFIRVFHICIALGFTANALILDESAAAHLWLGYALGALVLARILWGVIGPPSARFSTFLHRPAALRAQISDMWHNRKRAHLGHSPLGGLMIVNLLGALLALSATGVLLTFTSPPGWAEDAHEALVAWTGLSVLVHVAAILWESRRTGVNLILAMITGRKRVPGGLDLVE